MCVHNMILGFVTALKYLHAKKKELKCRILALQRHVTKIKIEDLLEALLKKKKIIIHASYFLLGRELFSCVFLFSWELEQTRSKRRELDKPGFPGELLCNRQTDNIICMTNEPLSA